MERKWLVALIVLLVLCCCCVISICGAGAAVAPFMGTVTWDLSFGNETPTPKPTKVWKSTPVWKPTQTKIEPTLSSEVVETPLAKPTKDQAKVEVPDAGAFETLKSLETGNVPVNDLRDLAGRLKNIKNIPATVESPAKPFVVGDKQKFWAINMEDNKAFQFDSTLRYATEHAYWWVENEVSYNESDLKKLADAFESKIYPTDRKFFGSEWTPGIDNDPHLYILYFRGLGGNIAGAFSSSDEVHPLAHQYSNAHELFLLNADNIELNEQFTYGVLAHEFQHMIHWYQDRNEETWINEGFSELASFLNGYDTGGHDFAYIMNPNIQLNDWPNDKDATLPHYGASFLFMTYFLDRFGDNASQTLVKAPENGLDSIDKVLKDLAIKDPLTNEQITADNVFADWVVASYLKDKDVADGRFTYHNYESAPQAKDTDVIKKCSQDWTERSVTQYGAEYIKVQCSGKYTLHFQGTTEVGVVPESAHSDKFMLWSNKGDESDMTLTQTFDFTNVKDSLKMNFWTWYDLEKDYDYVYLTASEDGKNWEILKTPGGTDVNPSGNSYGWGYNGVTNNWVQEEIDLSKFAGKKVTLRFEYVTDAAVNGEGFLLDDISIPAINYKSDFEKDTGGWDASGFVRIENRLPQTYQVSVIKEGKKTTVENVKLNPDQSFDLSLNFGTDYKNIVLVVSGTTRFTRQEAAYRFSFQPE
jgi:hypothetical protein